MSKVLEKQFYHGITFHKLQVISEKLHSRIFEECIFSNCDFSGSDLYRCRFVDCFFVDCNLSTAKLTNVGFQNISFRECKMMGIDFGACDDFLFQVKFESCVLDFSSFMDKKMNQTLFERVSLKNVVFIKTQLKAAKFKHADLEGAIFEEANLNEADFISATNYIINPDTNSIKKAYFSLDGLPGLLCKHNLNIV